MVEKKKIKKTEDVCETFKITEGKKEEIVESCGKMEIKEGDEKHEKKKANEILKKVLIGIGVFIIIFVAGIFFINSIRQFEYQGVEYKIVKEGKLVLYQTSLPINYNGGVANYNFYLRNDPRKLEKVSFEGPIYLPKNMVFNMSEEIKCEGDEIIALANFLKLYDIVGTKVIKDVNASCDPEGKYVYLNVYPGNVTKIVQTETKCYDMEIGNCEVLKGMEKYMVETFTEVNKMI